MIIGKQLLRSARHDDGLSLRLSQFLEQQPIGLTDETATVTAVLFVECLLELLLSSWSLPICLLNHLEDWPHAVLLKLYS
jgi:hypothetical protein